MDAHELTRKVYSWIDACRRETAIDPDPSNFELVMHLHTWHDVLQTISVYDGPKIMADQNFHGFRVRIDLDLPIGQVKLKAIWEAIL